MPLTLSKSCSVAASRAMLMRSAPASANSLNCSLLNGGQDKEIGTFEDERISLVRWVRSLETVG